MSDATPLTPPTEAPPLDPPQPRWPRVIGTISLIYAIGGMTCTGFQAIWIAILPSMPAMFRGGVEMSPMLRAVSIAQFAAGLLLGILMLVGAVHLLRRRARGVKLLKRWAILRITLAVLGLGIGVLMMPAQLQMQRSIADFKNEMLEQQKRPTVEQTDEELWWKTIMQMAIFTPLVVIYPTFLGFYLSRKKITDEIAEWDR